jgi:hypothetical protein
VYTKFQQSSINNNEPLSPYFKPDDLFLSTLIANCDKTSSYKSSNSIDNDDDESILADLRLFNKNSMLEQKSSSSWKQLDGYWKLRYTSNKFQVGYRGPPEVIMFVNSTARSTFFEISYPDNKRSLKKVLLQLVESSISKSKQLASNTNTNNSNTDTSTSIPPSSANEYPVWRYKVKSVELVRSPLITFFSKLPFVRHASFSALLAVPPVSSLTKQILKQVFPSLCALSIFSMTYLDDDICVQRSSSVDNDDESKIDNCTYNVFTRVYETWNPMKGWVFVSTV